MEHKLVAHHISEAWDGRWPETTKQRRAIEQLLACLPKYCSADTWEEIRRDPEFHLGALTKVLRNQSRRDPVVRALVEAATGKPPRQFLEEVSGHRLIRPRNRARILFLGADSDPTRRAKVDEELREIQRALWAGGRRSQFDLEISMATQIKDLQPLLRRARPGVLHFAGHGNVEKLIFADSELGKTVSIASLGKVFGLLPELRCVVLNACHSARQGASLADKFAGLVVGMDRAMDALSARTFAGEFYASLADGRSFEDAFQFGQGQLEVLRLPGVGIPRLYGGPDLRQLRLTDEV